MDTLQNTKEWFEKAVPNPNDRNFQVQLGVHIEEVLEMLQEIQLETTAGFIYMRRAKEALSELSQYLKNEHTHTAFKVGSLSLLDAICDQIVTGVGVAHMLGMDPVGALKEVNRSNYSKFDDNGNPIFNNQGKIAKSPNYTPPDLTTYLVCDDSNKPPL